MRNGLNKRKLLKVLEKSYVLLPFITCSNPEKARIPKRAFSFAVDKIRSFLQIGFKPTWGCVIIRPLFHYINVETGGKYGLQ